MMERIADEKAKQDRAHKDLGVWRHEESIFDSANMANRESTGGLLGYQILKITQ